MTIREELLEDASLDALAALVAIDDNCSTATLKRLAGVLWKLRRALDYGGAMENKD